MEGGDPPSRRRVPARLRFLHNGVPLTPFLLPSEPPGEPLEKVLDRYLLSGDEGAMEQVVARTRPKLLAAGRRIGRPQDAEDSVQSAYLSLVRKRGEPLEAPVMPWLLTAVIRIAYRRKAIDRRQEGTAQLLSVPSGLPAPDAEAMSAEESARLWREVARLPDLYRDPVVLHHLHGVPTPEVAHLLDLPEATVRTRLRRGRGLLKTRLPVGLALGLMAAVWFILDAAKVGGGFAAVAMGGVMTTGGMIGVGVAGAVIGAVIGAKLIAGGPVVDDAALKAADEKAGKAQASLEESKLVVESLRKEVDAAKKRSEEDGKRADALQAKIASLEEKAAATAAAAAAATPAGKGSGEGVTAPAADGLRFSFGEYDAALKEVDWKSVGESTQAMVPLITELRDALKEGGPFPLETAGKIQRLNGSLIQAAAKIMDKVPGSGVNGAYTHPSFMVNAMASTLEAAAMPLTETQAEALGRLGRDFSDRERARTASYDDRSLDLQKVLDEAEMKDQFFAQALALLSEKQRETLSPAETRGILGFDLFSSGLMLGQYIKPVPCKDIDGYLSRIEQSLVSQGGFPADRREDLKVAIKAWSTDIPAAWFSEPTELIMGSQPILRVEKLEECGRKQIVLFRKLLDEMGLGEEPSKAIRGSSGIAVPIVSK